MQKILIVEDDISMGTMYQRIFKLEGYDAVHAVDGIDALEKVATENPSAILLDIMMPRMNGIEVLERLKSNPSTKEIPVFMLTNLANTADSKTAMQMGAVAYIIKSEHDPSQVVEIVKKALPLSQPPSASPTQ